MAKDLENTMVGNNVYILTELSKETTNGLITQLSQWVDRIPFKNNLQLPQKPDEKDITEDTVYIIGNNNYANAYAPYDAIPENTPVLNVWINSGGGKDNVTQSFLTILNIAAAKGTIIKTYNLRQAGSNASIIAISGTKGYRYMAESAFNYIHFGDKSGHISHENEMEFVIADFKYFVNETKDIYLNKTNLTKKELQKYFNIEGSGIMSAKQCLEKGICDWVITNDGRFVNKVSDLKSKQR